MQKTQSKKQLTYAIKHAKDQLNASTGLPLSKIFSSETVQNAFDQSEITYRDRIFSPLITLFAFLSQSLSKRGSCREAVMRVAVEREAEGLEPCSLKTANYVRARQRLPLSVLMNLTRTIAFELTQKCRALNKWNWHDRQVKIVDGSTILAADTKANRAVYPIHGNQKTDIGFPIIRICGLISLSTGCIIDFAMSAYKGKQTGELTLARSLLRSLQPNDVLLGDALMDSYFFIAQVLCSGADALFEARRHADFREGKRNGLGDNEITLSIPGKPKWMSPEDYETYPKSIQVRLIQDGKRVLITTLLDLEKYSRKDLQSLYEKRWNVELDLRAIKDILDLEMLRSQSPEMLQKEVWAKLLAYNLIRLTMAEAGLKYDIDPRNLSFTGAIQAINAYTPFMHNLEGEKWDKMHNSLLRAIASQKVGNRPGRREPRAVKRRPKPFPRMQVSRQIWKKKRLS